MRIRDFLARPAGPPSAAAVALLLLPLLAALARAQQPASPPVEAVRQALRQELFYTDEAELQKGLAERKQAWPKLLGPEGKLQTLGDMAQALLLNDWSDAAAMTSPTRGVDREAYDGLVNRFLGGLRAELKAAERSPDVRAAVVTLAGEFGASARSGEMGKQGNRLLVPNEAGPGDLYRFTEVVAEVARSDPAPEARVAAAGALAKLQSDPRPEEVGLLGHDLWTKTPPPVTVPALGTMLKSSDVNVRRAAAQALGDLLRGTRSADRGGTAASPVVEPSPLNLPVFGPQVARAAGAVLGDKEPDAEVRRLAADALVVVGSNLKNRLKLRTTELSASVPQQMRPVVDALWAQSGGVGRATRDEDTRVRHTALRALEEMGEARQYWLAPAAESIGAPPTREKPRGGAGKPLGLGLVRPAEEMSDLTLTVAQAAPAKPRNEPAPLASSVPALVASLRDERVRNRLAALDAIEAVTTRPEAGRTLAQDLGPAPAAEIVRAVTRALSDSDRFVRWAAARTLGEMAPLGDTENAESVEQGAVRGLARLQYDNDPDVRMWSAQAVEKYGKAAQAAVPALAQAAVNRGDLEARISAAHAIQTIGGHPEEAVPALAEDLGASNVRLRRAAAEALSAYGAEAAAAKPALNRALFDSDPEVRRLASEAILKIGPKR